jgi:hypothetical protein
MVELVLHHPSGGQMKAPRKIEYCPSCGTLCKIITVDGNYHFQPLGHYDWNRIMAIVAAARRVRDSDVSTESLVELAEAVDNWPAGREY